MRIDRIKLVTELAKRDMTQKRLAELSGVSRQTITYIRGGKSCSDEVGQKIADALEIKLEKIME
mgnify:CR=1 FL=1